jgi:RNA polymerase sigma-70 factor (ECF subfamily)
LEYLTHSVRHPQAERDAATVTTLHPTAPQPTSAVSEGIPVRSLGKTDWAAAEELFSSTYPRLAGWVRRLVDDDETAHEIASEAFTRLLARWSTLDSPQSYLYMIATNLIRDHWRRTERERKAIRSITAGTSRDPVSHPAQDVDVRSLIQALPQRMRNAFLLHYYAGFGVREVAALLGRPEGTVKADLFQARTRLKATLGESDG